MIKTERSSKFNLIEDEYKLRAELVRRRQLQYCTIQAKVAPPLKIKRPKKFKIVKENEYEEDRAESKSFEKDHVKG
jgi:hypothetical protein